jgi:hypothetical protein
MAQAEPSDTNNPNVSWVPPSRLQRRLVHRTRNHGLRVGRAWLALATVAIAGCGDGPRAVSTVPPANQQVSRLAVQVAELETGIAEYCEDRSSGSASRADERTAADDVRRLIALARRNPHRKLPRDALANTATVLEADCANSPLQRPVNRALRP